MFGYLLILFTVLPALELMLLIKIGTRIGAGNTLLLILLTGVAGAALARLQGFIALRKIQESLNKGIMPNVELMDGLMILVGGIVLLTPGFITDTFGLLLLIPWTRNIVKSSLKRKFKKMIQEGQMVRVDSSGEDPGFPNRFRDQGYDDIDVS